MLFNFVLHQALEEEHITTYLSLLMRSEVILVRQEVIANQFETHFNQQFCTCKKILFSLYLV